MKVEPEVDVLDGEISGKNQVLAAARAHDGGVVSDAEVQPFSALRPAAPQPSHEFGFITEGHASFELRLSAG